jgi:ABC-2 type transport system permease protein
MISLLAQIKREFTAFFFSPIAYVVLVAAMLVNGIVFGMIVDFLSDPRSGHGAAMQILFSNEFYWFLTLIICPLITMRLLSEERHLGTLETLLTAPISPVGVVVAKYVAAVSFWIVLWLPTTAYALLLSRYAEIDFGPVASGYLGTLGIGMMLLSVGLFFSALSKNQIVSSLLGFGANMALFLLGLSASMSAQQSSDSLLGYMNLFEHMLDFSKGIVDTRHLIYYGSVTGFMLFSTVQVLQIRRWRG